MEYKVSFQGVHGVQGFIPVPVYGVKGFIPGSVWSTGFHNRGCMEYRVSFQGVYGV